MDRAAGLTEVAEHNVRLYQPNQFPITERNAAVAALRANRDKITFGDSKGQVSQGGDLGFLWGEYRTQPAPIQPVTTSESGGKIGLDNGSWRST